MSSVPVFYYSLIFCTCFILRLEPQWSAGSSPSWAELRWHPGRAKHNLPSHSRTVCGHVSSNLPLLWAVGGSRGTWREVTQSQGEPANSRRPQAGNQTSNLRAVRRRYKRQRHRVALQCYYRVKICKTQEPKSQLKCNVLFLNTAQTIKLADKQVCLFPSWQWSAENATVMHTHSPPSLWNDLNHGWHSHHPSAA